MTSDPGKDTFVNVTNADIFSEVKEIRKDLVGMSGHAQQLADHEKRMRKLERLLWGALGTGTTGLSASVADLIVRISTIKH